MLQEIVSWDGHTLNDSNYDAWFEVGSPAGVSARPSYTPRSRTFPKLSSVEIGGTSIVLHIQPKGTIHTQLAQLDAWFNIYDVSNKALVVKDTANSNKQWYVMARPIEPVQVSSDGVGEYIVVLALDEPIWRSVVLSSDTLSVIASGDDKELTVLGNWYARPVLTLTIGGAKNSGYKKTIWKPWYNPLSIVNEEPLEFTNGGINTTNLRSDTTVSNRVNKSGGITSSATTIPIDTSVGGGLPTSGGMCYVDSEQIYYTSISAGNMTVYNDGAGTTGRGWGGTTAATHADNAVMTKSHVLANLNDMRMFDGNQEIDCWVGAVGSATKVWIKQRHAPSLTMTTLSALGTGTITSISVAQTAANKAALAKLPSKFMAYIDSEVFFCANPDANAYRFTVTARAQKNTTAAAHVAGSTIRWLEHDFILAYGNPLAGAPERDDTVRPIIDETNSTNTSWVYTELKSENNLRSCGWSIGGAGDRRSPPSDIYSRIYTATENTIADPATDLGFAVKAIRSSAMWQGEFFIGSFGLYHPAGFTAVTITGKKMRNSTQWPSVVFQKSLDGINWVTVFTEATPASPSTWGALSSHVAVSLSGNYPYIRWYTFGGLPIYVENGAAYCEMDGGTFAINTSNVLQLAFSTIASDSYYLDSVIEIVETAESIRLQGVCKTDSVIVINCDKETITTDGAESGIAISWNTERDDWLNLPSTQQQSTCTIRYTEVSVTGVGLGIEWENREIL